MKKIKKGRARAQRILHLLSLTGTQTSLMTTPHTTAMFNPNEHGDWIIGGNVIDQREHRVQPVSVRPYSFATTTKKKYY